MTKSLAYLMLLGVLLMGAYGCGKKEAPPAPPVNITEANAEAEAAKVAADADKL